MNFAVASGIEPIDYALLHKLLQLEWLLTKSLRVLWTSNFQPHADAYQIGRHTAVVQIKSILPLYRFLAPKIFALDPERLLLEAEWEIPWNFPTRLSLPSLPPFFALVLPLP